MAGFKKSADGSAPEPAGFVWSLNDASRMCRKQGAWANSVYKWNILVPRVVFEPSPVFKAGFTSDYTVGEVSTKWVKDQRVWIVRDKEGIYVIFARCTHLGCTPRWLKTENKYKCPCHGSGFTKTGINFEGPAPRALERLKISLGPDGQIVVDKSKKFLFEKNEWDKPGAILRV